MRCRDVLQIRLVTLGGHSLSPPPPLPTLSLLPGCRDSNLRIFFQVSCNGKDDASVSLVTLQLNAKFRLFHSCKQKLHSERLSTNRALYAVNN